MRLRLSQRRLDAGARTLGGVNGMAPLPVRRARDAAAVADFDGLMRLYGRNFRLLGRLYEEFDMQPGSARVTARDGYLLALSVQRRTRYTTTVALVYSLCKGRGHAPPTPILRLQVRIYHDTRQAEVLPPGPAPSARERRRHPCEWLGVKWRFNYFLSNVLLHFSRAGHA